MSPCATKKVDETGQHCQPAARSLGQKVQGFHVAIGVFFPANDLAHTERRSSEKVHDLGVRKPLLKQDVDCNSRTEVQERALNVNLVQPLTSDTVSVVRQDMPGEIGHRNPLSWLVCPRLAGVVFGLWTMVSARFVSSRGACPERHKRFAAPGSTIHSRYPGMGSGFLRTTCARVSCFSKNSFKTSTYIQPRILAKVLQNEWAVASKSSLTNEIMVFLTCGDSSKLACNHSTRTNQPPLCGRGRVLSLCPLTSLLTLTRCAFLLPAHRVTFFGGVAACRCIAA